MSFTAQEWQERAEALDVLRLECVTALRACDLTDRSTIMENVDTLAVAGVAWAKLLRSTASMVENGDVGTEGERQQFGVVLRWQADRADASDLAADFDAAVGAMQVALACEGAALSVLWNVAVLLEAVGA